LPTRGEDSVPNFKALFFISVVFAIAYEYCIGEISTADLSTIMIGGLFLFVVIPGLLYFVQVEPHIVRFRRHLEEGFYKTPAGKIFLVAVGIGIVLLFVLL
jgi:hypothetical protein